MIGSSRTFVVSLVVLAFLAVSPAAWAGGAGGAPRKTSLQIQYRAKRNTLFVYLVAPRNAALSYPNCSLQLQHKVNGHWESLPDTGTYLDQRNPNRCLVLLKEPIPRLKRLARLHPLDIAVEVTMKQGTVYWVEGCFRSLSLHQLDHPHQTFPAHHSAPRHVHVEPLSTAEGGGG